MTTPSDDSNKLGAIGDIDLVLTEAAILDDVIVVAGDNLFSHSLADFAEFCRMKSVPVLGVYDVGTWRKLENITRSRSMKPGGLLTSKRNQRNPKYFDGYRALLLSKIYAPVNPSIPGGR